jgi:hypothetical protein
MKFNEIVLGILLSKNIILWHDAFQLKVTSFDSSEGYSFGVHCWEMTSQLRYKHPE